MVLVFGNSNGFLMRSLYLTCGIFLLVGNSGVNGQYGIQPPYINPPSPGPVPVPAYHNVYPAPLPVPETSSTPVPIPVPAYNHVYPAHVPVPVPVPAYNNHVTPALETSPVPVSPLPPRPAYNPYIDCRIYPVSPVCANNTRTFPNSCYVHAYFGYQNVTIRPGPCYDAEHPQFFHQFYEPHGNVPTYNLGYGSANMTEGNFSSYTLGYGDYPIYMNVTETPTIPTSIPTTPVPTTGLPPCINYYHDSYDPYNNSMQAINVTDRVPANLTCGSVIGLAPNTSYLIQTPSFELGSNYPPNFSCSHEFLGTEGCLPIVTCPFFSLTRSPNCSTDYFEVADPVGGSDRFCGRDGPQFVSTGVEEMIIRFQSGPRTDKGYSCIVRCAEPMDPIVNTTQPERNTTRCQCGVLGNGQGRRIVGGSNTRPNFYKWIVAFFSGNATDPFCSGSLINDRFILTSAHCFVDITPVVPENVSSVRAVLNEFDYSLADETVTITRTATKVILHPLFNDSSLDYDAALVEIEPVDLLAIREPKVTPICLPPRGLHTPFTGVIGTVIGWGNTQESGNRSTVLKQADVPIIANADCNTTAPSVVTAPDGRPTPRMLCAGFPVGGVDACQGDGGSPLSVNDNLNEKVFQVGIVIFGNGCARQDSPGIYTRITDINDWIQDTASQDNAVWCQDITAR